MKLSTVLKVLLALVVLIVGGLAIFLATLDVNQYKDRITTALEDATGRRVTLNGPMDLALGFSPALVAEDVSIGNADWAEAPHMASVGRLEAQVDILPLLQGSVRIVRLVLADATVALETNAEGAGNWSLGTPGADPAPAPEPDAQGAGMALDVQQVRLENAALSYRDGASGNTLSVALEHAAMTGSGLDAPLEVDIAGTYNDAAFTLVGSLGSLSAVMAPDGDPWPLDITATAGGATVTVAGTIADLAGASGLELTVTAKGERLGDLAVLARAAGQSVAVPALGPYSARFQLAGDADALAMNGIEANVGQQGTLRASVSGSISDLLSASGLDLNATAEAPDPGALSQFGIDLPVPLSASATIADVEGGYDLRSIQAQVGRSSLSGGLQVFLGEPRPAVLGQVSASLLDLNELAGSGGGGGGQSDTEGRVIPDTPLPLHALRIADADVRITVDKAVLPGGTEMANLDLGVTLAGGTLALNPLAARVAGGSLNGTAVLEPTGGDAASVALDLSGDGIVLGDLAASLGNADAIQGGPTTLRLALRGHGATLRQIAATLNGGVLVHTTDANINNGAVDWAGGDLLTQIGDTVNPFSEREPTTPVQCLVFNMTATNGVLANDHGLAVETNRMVVGGGGAFDLGAERLNLKIAPRPRPGIGVETGLGKIVEIFAVTGSFASPRLEMDPEAALRTGLKTAASAAGAVATGGLSLLGESLAGSLLGTGDDGEMEPCLVALGEKDPGEIGTAEGAGEADRATGADIGSNLQDAAEGAAEDASRALDEAVGGLVGGMLGGGSGTTNGTGDGTGDGTEATAPTDGGGGDGGGAAQPSVGDAIQKGLGGLFGD